MASSEPVLRNGEYKVGEHQPRRWNDLGFSILFVAHLFGMASATAFYVPMASEVARGYATNTTNTTNSEDNRLLQQGNEDYYNNNQNYYNSSQNYYSENDNNDFDPYYSHEVTPQQILALVGGVGVISLVICSLNLQIMVCCAKPLIKIALICNALSMCIMAIMSFANGMVLVGVIGAVFAFLAICFACSVWQRIPFAASNLAAATTAIRQNLCVTSFAYLSVVISFLWNLWWFVTVSSFVAVKYFEQAEEQNNNNDGTEVAYQADPKTGFIMFFFFVSYYWTYQVIKNHLHVTIAGVVGTWWFTPQEASSCCSSSIGASWCRASTYSFGSICFGSLIVAIIQGIREMLNLARQSDETGILICIIDCCFGCIESLAEYFNQWAYVFVGLYGYEFIDAAQNVVQLFQKRGWTVIIADYLVDRVLLLISVIVGIVMGIVALAIAATQNLIFSDNYGGILAPFFVGFVLGLGFNNVLMNVIGSAVNTVIVCYAEAPAEFEQNHPELSAKMRHAWAQSYPEEFHQ